MKSSKYTQATAPNDNELGDYPDVPGMLTTELNFNEAINRNVPCQSREYLLKSSLKQEENNANHQEFEMVCNCALKDIVYYPKPRTKRQYNSEQDIALANQRLV